MPPGQSVHCRRIPRARGAFQASSSRTCYHYLRPSLATRALSSEDRIHLTLAVSGTFGFLDGDWYCHRHPMPHRIDCIPPPPPSLTTALALPPTPHPTHGEHRRISDMLDDMLQSDEVNRPYIPLPPSPSFLSPHFDLRAPSTCAKLRDPPPVCPPLSPSRLLSPLPGASLSPSPLSLSIKPFRSGWMCPTLSPILHNELSACADARLALDCAGNRGVCRLPHAGRCAAN